MGAEVMNSVVERGGIRYLLGGKRMAQSHEVRIGPLPAWLDWRRLLGPGVWEWSRHEDGRLEFRASLSRADAADLAVRLRGVGIAGSRVQCVVRPPLQRGDLRKANAEEARRYRKRSQGFSREGAELDEEGKMSLTPEVLALELGLRVKGMKVIDACAGAGGNAIGFARAGCQVQAIEIHAGRLAMARRNARLYGVLPRIDFLHGDAVAVLPELAGDLLFVDPPWGISYSKERVTLEDLGPCRRILSAANHIPRVWIKVPPSFDPSELPDYVAEAVFGVGEGDRRRVKFLLMRKGAQDSSGG